MTSHYSLNEYVHYTIKTWSALPLLLDIAISGVAISFAIKNNILLVFTVLILATVSCAYLIEKHVSLQGKIWTLLGDAAVIIDVGIFGIIQANNGRIIVTLLMIPFLVLSWHRTWKQSSLIRSICLIGTVILAFAVSYFISALQNSFFV